MPVALVTGGVAETAGVVARLERHGFEVHRARREPNAACLRSVDCYVQLPEDPPAGAQSDCARLVWRLDLLAAMARCLAPEATVILAVKNAEPPPPGESHDLLLAFAAVALEEAARVDVRLVVVPAAELAGPERVPHTATGRVPAFT